MHDPHPVWSIFGRWCDSVCVIRPILVLIALYKKAKKHCILGIKPVTTTIVGELADAPANHLFSPTNAWGIERDHNEDIFQSNRRHIHAADTGAKRIRYEAL